MRRVRNVFVGLVAVVVVAVGCSTTQSPQAPAPPAKLISLIDARWMGFDTSAPWNWKQIDRRIMKGFQQFGFRPVGETEQPHPCQGCGLNAPTAEVKIYAPGEFDPTNARTGQPVDVNGKGGFFRAAGSGLPATDSDGFQDAMLTWQYADNAWATVRGLTTVTMNLDRMLELARALRPNERTPVPLSLKNVPASMPLAAIHILDEPIFGGKGEYDTRLNFASCIDFTNPNKCRETIEDSGALQVRFLPQDGDDGGPHPGEVAWRIGGKDGQYVKSWGWAAVQVQQGMLAKFDFSPPRGTDAYAFEAVLAGVEWAADPGNEATWRPITDWVT
jgi:hypothetical protein